MPCYAPLTAWHTKEFLPSGKRGITFQQRNALFIDRPLKLPCGQCIGCRLEKSRQWAMRCLHEKQLHQESAFLTLTYDNEHMPPDGTLVKKHLSAFCKRLHNRLLRRRGIGIRFYACGEYGETTRRPHYHAIIFGYGFPDKKFYKNAKRGERLYTSDEVAELWPFGFNVIGDVTFDSAAYVARYVMKKVTGERAEQFYQWIDADGVVHEVLPEFTNMSRRPGIGAKWFEKYGEHSYVWDSIIMNGKAVRPPRYYDTKYEIIDAARLAKLKVVRRRKAAVHKADQTVDRRRVIEKVTEAQLRQKGRDL